MYLSEIGKTFLKHYNKVNKVNCTAKDFVNNICVPLFFWGEKPLIYAQNTPFTIATELNQLIWNEIPTKEFIRNLEINYNLEANTIWNFIPEKINSKVDVRLFEKIDISKTKTIKKLKYFELQKFMVKLTSTKEYKDKCLKTFNSKFEKSLDMSVVVGGASAELYSSTSAMFEKESYINFTVEDKYCTWIGFGLSLTVSGGYNIAINDGEILYKIYKGWVKYSELLKDESYSKLKDKQLNTWNTIYLMSEIKNIEPYSYIQNTAKLDPILWNQFLIELAGFLNKKTILNTYIFQYGQQNTTIGLIPINFEEIRRPIEYYKTLYSENEYLNNAEKINKIFGSGYKSFEYICLKGVIGIYAMKPVNLEYIMQKKNKKDEEINYKTYKSWIMAVLNKKEILDLSKEFAAELIKYENITNTGKTKLSNEVEKLLDCYSVTNMFKQICNLSKKEELNSNVINKIKNSIYDMDKSTFDYFMAAIKINYNFPE